MSFPTLPPLAHVLQQHGLLARKSLGQHFLLDTGITDTITRYAGSLEHVNVIEIGPGPGGLTRSLLKAGAKKLYVVEKDDRCISIMQELRSFFPDRLEILHADGLETDLLACVPAPRKIVANLPYNVGTLMLLNWLDAIYNNLPPPAGERAGVGVDPADDAPHPLLDPPPSRERKNENAFESLTLMFQKEVAERIVAVPGTKDFGRISVLSQWLCDCRADMELPPEAFSPPPKVSSMVVTLTPRAKPLVDVKKECLETVMAKAFGQRRKMLRQSLKGLAIPAETLLEKANIDPTLRPEQLNVLTLCNLAKVYQSLLTNPSSPS